MNHNIDRTKHAFTFYRYGKDLQAAIQSSEDLYALQHLDPRLWVALSCPTTNVFFDKKTLEFLDSDNDQRIKIAEVIDAVNWICTLLKEPFDIANLNSALPLSAINDSHEEGKKMLDSIKQILRNLGKSDSLTVEIEDVANTEKIFSATAFNGDGVITEDVAKDEFLRQVITSIMDCCGTEVDRSGKLGVSLAQVEQFLVSTQSYLTWQEEGQNNKEKIFVDGESTYNNFEVLTRLKDKINDYFIRSRLAAYDPKYIVAGQELESDYLAMLKQDLSTNIERLRELPISIATTENVLKFDRSLNPSWLPEISLFIEQILKPYFESSDELSEELWQRVLARYKAYDSWWSSKQGENVEKLGAERLKEIVNSDVIDKIKGLIERDKELEPKFQGIMDIEKLLRYHSNLYLFLNNFVNFSDFYEQHRVAIFQVGTLLMDCRSCELCMKVDDIAKHSQMAASCFTYLAYAECQKKDTPEKLIIAAAFTEGSSEHIVVGKNGIFIDRQNQIWEASIIKIIDHPISIRQAFWAPYKKIANLVKEQIEKYAASKEKDVTDSISDKLNAPVPQQPSANAPAFDTGKFAGIFAALGLAFAAFSSAIASIVAALMSLSWWQVPLAICAVALIISGPSMIIVAIRLRQRNLGSLLNASGWAVNAQAKINVAFGHLLTKTAQIPYGSKININPFEEKIFSFWFKLITILIIVILLLLTFYSDLIVELL